MNYQLNWSILWSGQTGGWLLNGLLTTLEISSLAWLLALTLGNVAGALRTAPIPPFRWLASAYVEFFRNVPLLVWMFFWYFGMPPLLPQALQDWLLDHGAELPTRGHAATTVLVAVESAQVREGTWAEFVSPVVQATEVSVAKAMMLST